MDWVDEPVVEDGIRYRRFRLKVDDEIVPGCLWAPENANGPRPLVLFGHGGGATKDTGSHVDIARSLVSNLGYAAVATDQPGFGDRLPPGDTPNEERIAAFTQLPREERSAAFEDGGLFPQLPELTAALLVEWRATLDAMQRLPEVGAGPVGFYGMSGGTARGALFVAEEPRAAAAVFGICGVLSEGGSDYPHVTEALMKFAADRLEPAARAVSVPVLFFVQWDDQLVSRQAALDLFEAFGSQEKTMHVNRGQHLEIPGYERAAVHAFFERHLGRA